MGSAGHRRWHRWTHRLWPALLPSLGSALAVQIAALARVIIVESRPDHSHRDQVRDRNMRIHAQRPYSWWAIFLITAVAHNPLIDALGVLTAAAQALGPPGRPIDTTAAVGVADAALRRGSMCGCWSSTQQSPTHSPTLHLDPTPSQGSRSRSRPLSPARDSICLASHR